MCMAKIADCKKGCARNQSCKHEKKKTLLMAESPAKSKRSVMLSKNWIDIFCVHCCMHMGPVSTQKGWNDFTHSNPAMYWISAGKCTWVTLRFSNVANLFVFRQNSIYDEFRWRCEPSRPVIFSNWIDLYCLHFCMHVDPGSLTVGTQKGWNDFTNSVSEQSRIISGGKATRVDIFNLSLLISVLYFRTILQWSWSCLQDEGR